MLQLSTTAKAVTANAMSNEKIIIGDFLDM